MAGGKLISTGVEFPDATTQTTSGLPLTGGTMTGTIAGFTSTGIDDNATSTAITINASENVGVGAVSPTQRMQVDGGAVRVTGDQAALVSNQGLMLGFTGDKSNFYSIGSSGGGVGTYSFKGYNYTTGAGSERMSIDSAGNVTVSTGNLVIGTSGKGIDFSADGNASGMTSEVLDDYETGTWTPVVKFGGTTQSVTGVFSEYIKIGKQVTIFMRWYNSTSVSGTGNMEVEGLPFTPDTDSEFYFGMPCSTDRFVIDDGYISATVYPGDTKLRFFKAKNSNTSGPVSVTNTDVSSNNSQIRMVLIYQTA